LEEDIRGGLSGHVIVLAYAWEWSQIRLGREGRWPELSKVGYYQPRLHAYVRT
jgi:hypothetical protein